MHSSIAFLTDLAIVLGVAALTSVASQRLRLPPVFGYLVAGVLIGPTDFFPLVADIDTVQTLSELGVILLMFSLGLGFTLQKLARLASTAGLIAAVEIGLCVSIGYLVGQAFGWTGLESLFAGAIVSVSSTMIIAKVFEDQRIAGPLAEIVYGVLVVEDLVAILFLAILTAVIGGTGTAVETIAGTLPRLGLFLAVVTTVGLFAVPRAFRWIVRQRRDETTLVASVGLCFVAALLAHMAGYSVALGAFLAGSLVAEGGVSKQVEPLIRPLRDMFAAIFFVAVGMLIQPAAILEYWPAVLALTAAVLLGKTLGVTTGAFLAGLGTRTAVRAGLSMGQIGEFSFIIAALGVSSGAIGGFLAPVAVFVSVITALLSPILVARSTAVANFADRRLPHALQTYATLYGSWVESVRHQRLPQSTAAQVRRLARFLVLDAVLFTTILIGVSLTLTSGTGRLATLLGMSMSAVQGGAIVLALAALFPLLYGIVRSARSLGTVIALQAVPAGDAGRADLGAAPRRMLRLSVQLGVVLIVGVPMVAATLPVLPSYAGPVLLGTLLLLLGVAFWRSARDLQGHIRAGAMMIVESLAMTQEQPATPGEMPPEVRQLLPGIGELTQLTVHPGDAAAGQTLTMLNLRGLTGASVVAISRGEERIVLPEASECLQAGDVLALTGSQRAIEAAAEVLRG